MSVLNQGGISYEKALTSTSNSVRVWRRGVRSRGLGIRAPGLGVRARRHRVDYTATTGTVSLLDLWRELARTVYRTFQRALWEK